MSHYLWLSVSLCTCSVFCVSSGAVESGLCFLCMVCGRGPVSNRLCGSPVMSRADSGVIKWFHILSPLSVDQGNTGISCGRAQILCCILQQRTSARALVFMLAFADRLSGLECNRRKCINATTDNMTFTVLAQMLMF